MDVPVWLWATTLGAIVAMLLVDLFAHRDNHVVETREAAIWSAVWIVIGLAYGGLIAFKFGGELATQYFAGYVIEKSLAVDNIFVFAMLFTYFQVPREYQHRVLFYGVIGAFVFRAIFIALGAALIEEYQWILYVFGAFLVFTGIKMARQDDHAKDPSQTRTARLFKRFIPMTDDWANGHLFTRLNGKRVATPLLMVLVLVEVTDIIFAVDSIPAIFAVTQEPFLVFASNAFAILGLRALYFLLADLVHRFVYLKIGLSLVLVWVGIKMLLLEFVKIPTTLSLAVVLLVITVSIVLSLRATREPKEIAA